MEHYGRSSYSTENLHISRAREILREYLDKDGIFSDAFLGMEREMGYDNVQSKDGNRENNYHSDYDGTY
jgi:hypothetical protein